MSFTYAIGDLHGRLDVLERCLDLIEKDRKGESAKIVFLGDYIDRGPNSADVVERLIQGSPSEDVEWVVLGGNHEDMCIMAHAEPDTHKNWWVANGGAATLDSYPDKEVYGHHLYWMSQLPTIHTDAHRLFVHAGIYAAIPLANQNTDHLRWVRHGRNDEVPSADGFYVVHGHTPYMDGPVVLETRCNLDTQAYKTGRCTVAVFDETTAKPTRFLTANCGYAR